MDETEQNKRSAIAAFLADIDTAIIGAGAPRLYALTFTIYGFLVVRAPLPSLVAAVDEDQQSPGAIRFWKSWPDGSRCQMLTVRADQVFDYKTPISFSGNAVEVPPPWHPTVLRGQRRLTFDHKRDWWTAPPSIRSIVLRLKPQTHNLGPGDVLVVEPRRS